MKKILIICAIALGMIACNQAEDPYTDSDTSELQVLPDTVITVTGTINPCTGKPDTSTIVVDTVIIK